MRISKTSNDLRGLCSRVFNTPLMLEPSSLAELANVLASYRGLSLSDIDLELLALQNGPSSRQMGSGYSLVGEGTAVIDIQGKLMHKTGGMSALSGLTSYKDLALTLNAAISDSQVRNVLLNLKSPGGEVSGVFDLAQRINELSAVKPIFSLVDEMAASAAYMLASATSRIYVPQTAEVGSIGVVTRYENIIEQNKMDGIQVEYFFAGANKLLGNPEIPMTDAMRSTIQASVDSAYETFTLLSAKYRGMSQNAMKATEAAMFTGQDAVNAGLADEVMSAEDVITLVSTNTSTRRNLNMNTNRLINGVVVPAAQVDMLTQSEVDTMVTEATAKAKAEGVSEGIKAEQARVQSILEVEGSEGKMGFVLKALSDPGMTAEKLSGYLVAIPAETVLLAPAATPTASAEFLAQMAAIGNPDLGVQGGEAAELSEIDKLVASIQAGGQFTGVEFGSK